MDHAGSRNANERRVLDSQFGALVVGLGGVIPAIDFPKVLGVALFTTTPGETGDGTEVARTVTSGNLIAGSGYDRFYMVNDSTNWPPATTVNGVGTKSNGTVITFPDPTGSWGSITSFGIYDAPSACFRASASSPGSTGTLVFPWGMQFFAKMQTGATVPVSDPPAFSQPKVIVRFVHPQIPNSPLSVSLETFPAGSYTGRPQGQTISYQNETNLVEISLATGAENPAPVGPSTFPLVLGSQGPNSQQNIVHAVNASAANSVVYAFFNLYGSFSDIPADLSGMGDPLQYLAPDGVAGVGVEFSIFGGDSLLFYGNLTSAFTPAVGNAPRFLPGALSIRAD